MKVKLMAIGKTEASYLNEGIEVYKKKLPHYFPFQYVEIQEIKQTKNLSFEQQKTKEGELLLSKLTPSDTLVLFDENGKMFSSVGFSDFLQQQMHCSKQLVFLIGGPYGFSAEIYQRANYKIALSLMTFSHQMVRLIALEQLYRGASILKNEPYHHQ